MTPWYAGAVFYEIPVRSFFDSNGDGVGDIAGVTAKLDYLQWLGVDCIWLTPFFQSPLRDGGYDVSDYRQVLPEFGTIEDLRTLVDEIHDRDMKVIGDLVLNHTSSDHPWFQDARQPGSDRRDWYVWSDTNDLYADTRIIFLDSEASNWTWDDTAGAFYWHRFYHHQPDLNYDNPEVLEAMLDVGRFWLDFGMDGLRLDAIPYLIERDGTICENLPETHDVIKQVRAMVDAEFPNAMLLAEANQPPEDVVAYFGDGDECHMAYHFPVMPRLYMALELGDVKKLRRVLEETPDIPQGCQWAMFLRNHDELTLEMVTPEERDFMWQRYAPDNRMRLNLGIRRRLAPLLGNDRSKIQLLHALLLTLPGSPILYYGDEIGMGDDIWLPDRDGVRTPMQWSPDGGFSTASTTALPMITGDTYGPAAVNAADQRGGEASLLNWLRQVLAVRRRYPALATGAFRLLDAPDAVLAFERAVGDDRFLVAADFSGAGAILDLGMGAATDAVSGEAVDLQNVHIGPYAFRWLISE